MFKFFGVHRGARTFVLTLADDVQLFKLDGENCRWQYLGAISRVMVRCCS